METTTTVADEKGIGEVDIVETRRWIADSGKANGRKVRMLNFRLDHSNYVLFENYMYFCITAEGKKNHIKKSFFVFKREFTSYF